jgi:protein-L-isoaspartate(D-aspartate) O-methyltransferase
MAYSDNPLPIGEDQTISQPYVVAVMTEALAVEPGDRVLEIGTGSGYQAAILAEMGVEVFTVEYHEKLSASARRILERLDYADIHYRIGDGRAGWPEEAPFARIIVTAAPDTLPQSLADQLKSGGRLVIPIGRWEQDLFVCTRQPNGTLEHERLFAVRFVPLV